MGYNKEFWTELNKKLKEKEQENNIAPTANGGTTKDRKWFNTEAFNDGFQWSDVPKSIGATAVDTTKNAVAGILNGAESVGDATIIGANELVKGLKKPFDVLYDLGVPNTHKAPSYLNIPEIGSEESDKQFADLVAQDVIDGQKIANTIITKPIEKITKVDVNKYSLSGDKLDSVVESGGQLALQLGAAAAANAIAPGVGAKVGMTIMGMSSFGSEFENAINNNATYSQALVSGLVSAGAEIITEKLGGINFGGKTLVDVIGEKAAQKFSSKLALGLIKAGKFGASTAAEGVEELASGYIQAFGQKFTYMSDKEINELFSNEDKLESFIGGALLGGTFESVNALQTKANGVDYLTGEQANETKVINKLYEDATKGKDLTSKEKSQIRDKIVKQMENGEISTDTIESILGGEEYKAYKNAYDERKALRDELETLRSTKQGDMTDIQTERMNELKGMNLDDNTAIDGLRKKLDDKMKPLIQNRLSESYNEVSRVHEKFDVNLSKYKGKQRDSVERAIQSGVLNNTNRTHALVDFLSAIESRTGIQFDYTNNKRLAESGFAVAGRTVNAFEKNGTVTLNVNSAKSWQTAVGHDITHVLEGANNYDALKTAIYEYAESKGELESRRAEIEELYNGIEADIDKELTAELVGDYLFSDSKFIDKLAGNRTLFQKIYDEIKYLYKVATGKELTAIEKVKEEFDRTWKELEKKGATEIVDADGKLKYSIAGENAKTANISTLNDAKARIANGEDSEIVRQETGWFQGYDGKWRFEIDDSDVEMLENNIETHYLSDGEMYRSAKLEDVIGHIELFASYPQLKDYTVIIQETEPGVEGSFYKKGKQIAINQELFTRISDVDEFLNKKKNEIRQIENTPEFKEYNKFYEGEYANLDPAEWLELEKIARDKFYNSEIGKRYYELNWGKSSRVKKEIGWSKQAKAVLLHEVQHAIQEIEGFASGANTNNLNYDRVAGEIEARDVSNRLDYTAEQRKNTRPDIDRTDVVFADGSTYQASAYADKFGEQIDNWLQGKMPKDNYFDLGITSPALVKSGAEKLPLVMPENVIYKFTTDYNDHSISLDDIKRLPYELQDPVFTFKGSVENSIVALTEITDKIGNEVIVAIHLSKKQGRYIVNRIASVYGKNNIKNYVLSQIEKGNLINPSTKKAYNWFTTKGLQLPEVVQTKLNALSNNTIPQKAQSVNTIISENVENDTGKAQNSLSYDGEATTNDSLSNFAFSAPIRSDIKPKANTPIKDIAPVRDDIAPVRKDIAPVAENAATTDSNFEAPLPNDVTPATAEEAIPSPDENTEADSPTTLEAIKTELSNIKELRSEAFANYNQKIEQKQKELESKKNKNSKVANNLKIQIERIKRIRDSMDADYSKRINNLETRERLVRDGKPTKRKEHYDNIISNVKTEFSNKGYDFDKVLEKAKNLATFRTVDNTPQRVMEKALGYKEGGLLADLTVNKVAQNETEGIKWLNSFTNRKNGLLAKISKQYNIKPGSKESAAAQMYAEGFYVNDNNEIIKYGDDELARDFPDIRVRNNIIELSADPRIRQIYDETLNAINESRTRNAYPEIPRLDNYFLHFRAMEDTFSKLGLPFNPNDIKAKDLPTDLNGVTADLKPGQPYFASSMHRKGKRTSFDLLGGLERYLTSAKDQIYHIDDIQTLRALRNYIADTYGQAKGLENLDSLTEEEAQERIKEVYGSHLSTFAKFLNEEANVIAGKTALIDRGLEGIIDRRGLTFLNTVNKQVGSNMVGFNISSSLTNFLPVAQTFAKTNKFDFLKAFTQTVSNKIGSIFGKSDSFSENSPVMIRRKGADRFYRTPFQKVGDVGYVLMSAVDDISTEMIARTKYNEFTRKGMNEQQAHFETDKWVSRLMGDRSLGQQPQLYNSKTLGIFTKFQLEVRNQLDSQFYDTIQEAKVSNEDIQNGLERNAKIAARVTSTFVQLAVAQHLFGKAFESVAGYNPAFDIISVLATLFGFDDDDESEDTVLDNIEQGFLELLEDLPYTSTFTGGRIPISSALPVSELVKGTDNYGNDKSRLKILGEVAPYYVLPGGYGQIKKTMQGLNMFNTDEKHPIAGSYTGSGNLRFPVEDTPLNRVQAGLFGQYANKNAREYFDNGYAPLNDKQIQEFKDVDIPIKDYWEYREGLKEINSREGSTVGDKFDYVAGLDLPVSKKNILINNIVDRKDKVDLTDYDKFASYAEFDLFVKNRKMYDFLQDNNIPFKNYITGEKGEKEAYSWAANNPEGYSLSKAVTDDITAYKAYTKALNDIEPDKNAKGEVIKDSRSKKVAAFVNSLDLSNEAKYILYKSEFKSYNAHNRDIVNYIESRDDLSYNDKVNIYKKLGFTIENGRVYWK